jgi:replicative DNA helicase
MHSKEYARQGKQVETSAISSGVKAMAKELKVPVIVLSQLSRAPEQRGSSDARPKLSDLRDSGAIEQDADVVMMLRRPSYYPGSEGSDDARLAIVDVAKQRNGPTGEVALDFDRDYTRFSDRAVQFEEVGGPETEVEI